MSAPQAFNSIANNFVGTFPSTYEYFYSNLGNLQLDIVGFLAVLGEGSVLANAQVSTLSRLVFIPRLLPAPQALLRPSRPSKLQSELGWVTGVHSGNKRDYINHIGHLVLDAEKMPEYSVRCVKIERVPGESNGKSNEKRNVTSRALAPQAFLAIIGCFQSLVLLGLAVAYRDGMAILAVCLLSLLSSLVGIANKWRLRLHSRDLQGIVPKGDVVIRYPKGNFLIVECAEEVARELYFAPETIEYFISHPPIYRLISLMGTMMMMFGVIALANAQIQLQLAFAAAYIFINAAYWIVAALPSKMNWDISCFKIEKQRFGESRFDKTKFEKARDREKPMDKKTFADHNPTFTWALWRAIIVTKRTEWIGLSQATPKSKAWEDWLQDALKKAKDATWKKVDGVTVWDVPDWDPQAALTQCLVKYTGEESKHKTFVPDATAGSEDV
ncbi:hypothetical protein BLS_000526 [Venturia inaequalis]|uniref:Uncharacterized protein n=1 Tax=Venturia inaequalis TaxID=5025 RepID=A0A8H3V821_VENIN|nr:hypothetical protein BLS_000526 [Venturia inaequalis]KAE9988292.1 hypothetical protein EG328_011665 [Venturia inaequalis]KAE9994495.1 hypothetical protein EG327_009173 [Venturia inaequalis]RDI86302.1 hypothetical protein Vi05172_g3895 [Venturia inaequalis]